MKFRHIAILASILLFSLAAMWMFASELMLTQWGVAYSSETGLLSRRAAAFYTGIGLMLLLARNAEPSRARAALALGFTMTCFILAILGILEWHNGNANNQILIAVSVETILGLAFLLTNKRQ